MPDLDDSKYLLAEVRRARAERDELLVEVTSLKARTTETVELVERLRDMISCDDPPHRGLLAAADTWLATQGTALPRPSTAETGRDRPWPLRDVVAKLLEATRILLARHDYDGHGHEEVRAAASAAETYLREWGGETAAEPRAEAPVQLSTRAYAGPAFIDDAVVMVGAPAPQARTHLPDCALIRRERDGEPVVVVPRCDCGADSPAQAREAEPTRGESAWCEGCGQVHPLGAWPHGVRDPRRNEHSVIDVARRLVEGSTGTGDAAPNREALATWLEWRVRAGWGPSGLDALKSYDAAVHVMATSALKLYREREQ